MIKKILLPVLLVLAQLSWAQIGQYIPKQASPPRLVNDFTGTLTEDQVQTLENKLKIYDDTTSNQIAVVIIPTTGDYPIDEVATQLGRDWGVGNKENNNGVVLLIAKEDRKVFIAPGYGLEGAIPDITAKHIIEEQIVPNFRENDFYRGIDYGTDAIMQAAAGEYQVPEGYSNRGSDDEDSIIFSIIVFLIFIGFILSRFRGGGGSFMSRRGYRNWHGPSTVFFPPSSFGSGSGFGSGGGGGGFGGFGGGSFGGGGAGGSW